VAILRRSALNAGHAEQQRLGRDDGVVGDNLATETWNLGESRSHSPGGVAWVRLTVDDCRSSGITVLAIPSGAGEATRHDAAFDALERGTRTVSSAPGGLTPFSLRW
jgi:hypothetical protein